MNVKYINFVIHFYWIILFCVYSSSTICLGFPVGISNKISPDNEEDIRDMGRSLDWEGPLEEGMATHSSILAWIITWTEEPGRPQSIGLHRVRHEWSDLESWTICLSLLPLLIPWPSKPSLLLLYFHSSFLIFLCFQCGPLSQCMSLYFNIFSAS